MEKSTSDIWITNPPPEDEDEIKEPQTLLGKVIDIIFTFLESIGGVLISAYGEPWFAPSDGSRGLYILKLEK